MIKVKASDGHTFDAFRATPSDDVKGGLVVLQEIFGMTEQLKNVTRYWAGQGYDTILPAMYDRITPETVLSFDDMEGAQAMAKQLNADVVLNDVTASVAAVESNKGVSIVGFCWVCFCLFGAPKFLKGS